MEELGLKNGLLEIPEDVQKSSVGVRIKEKTLEFKVDDKDVSICYLDCKPAGRDPQDPPVLFLHGASFSAQTWKELNSIQIVASSGHRAVAVDLPGFGKSPRVHASGEGVLSKIISELELSAPVIISPSMSGSYSIPYLMSTPSTATQRASAFIAIAPVFTSSVGEDDYKQCEVPTLILYGERDKDRLGGASEKDLKNIPKSTVYVIKEAGHACYMNKPEEWQKLLYTCMKGLDSH